ncbi:TonB-dependent receptor domain-containing protein [Hylemonella sp. W303a]|uniref:TonB-dependent receptor domain-containing protein n=1 Tax=Hylemonella sp. W303a TaxID=3389873 RepID=UPI00396B2FF6
MRPTRPLVLHQRFTPAPLALAAAMAISLAMGHAPLAYAQSAAATSAANPIVINIPAQPLGQALNELARQANLQMTFPAALVAGKQAPAVSGNLTPRQALDRLIAGHDLFASIEAASVIVRPVPPSREASPAVEDGVLPVVVVTGTKRDQGVQQATQSVAVFREQDTVGLSSVPQAFERVPNVTQQSIGFLPTVRGLDGNGIAAGGGGAVTGASPRLSTYIDGVARTYGATPDGQGSFWDMAQLEVYRGAQSTQLGQNAISGAIVQTTNDPKFKDEAAVQVGARTGGTTYDAAFMLNKVLSDQVAIRLTGEAVDGKNAIDYSGFTGTGLTAADRDEMGRMKYGRYRFKASYLPTDDLLLKLTLEREDRKNPFTPDLGSNSSRRELVGGRNGDYFDSVTDVAALNTGYEINGEWSFDTILSQQKADTSFGPPVVGNPDPAAFYDFRFKSDEKAFEPKLAYKSQNSRTGAVVGAFVKERERTDTGKPGSAFALEADDQASSRSLYADTTIELSPSWDILLAGRYQNDTQKRDFSALGGLLTYNFNEKNTVFLPKIGATYHYSPDAALSLLAYKGYNASGGGVSFVTFTPYTYKKETSTTVELVSRTQWLNKILTANANLFFTELNDTQAMGVGPGGAADRIYLNIDKARTKGLEVDLIYQPDSRTQLAAALGLLETEIVNFGSAANSSKNGNELGMAPRVSANIEANFVATQRLTLGGNVTYVGERFSNFDNLPEDRLDSYTIASLNARYRISDSITATPYINNLFDKEVQTDRTTSTNVAYFNSPRTVGVKLKADF